jgi:hypothetical protein
MPVNILQLLKLLFSVLKILADLIVAKIEKFFLVEKNFINEFPSKPLAPIIKILLFI